MRKLLVAAVAACALVGVLATPANAGGYSAIALGPDGQFAFVSNHPTMERARAVAKRLCQGSNDWSCERSTSEADHWFFAGGYCNGEPYTGASPQGARRAAQIVRMKGRAAGRPDCWIYVNY